MEQPAATLTVVYDNNAPVSHSGADLSSAWGFSCLIETSATTVLFDTGGDGPTLMHNLSELGIDLADIDIVVLSHYHSDHTGGLSALLDACEPSAVFMPRSFPDEFKTRIGERTHVAEITSPTDIAPGIRSTGEMGLALIEQAITVETSSGLALITGCAHPGIVKIATRAAEWGDLALILGGFHLKDSDDTRISQVIAELKRLDVQQAAPTHCSGERGCELFRKAFGDAYVAVGLGSKLVLS